MRQKEIALEYAPSPKRSHWLRRFFVLSAIAVLLVAMTWRFYPRLSRNVRSCMAQRRWTTFRLPECEPVYEEIPVPAPPPNPWNEFIPRRVAHQHSTLWKELQDFFGYYEDVIVFSHMRTTSSGVKRLVLVGRPIGDCFSVCVVSLGDLWEPPALLRNNFGGDWGRYRMFQREPSQHLRVYYGQPDQTNESRFRIRIEQGSNVGYLEGELCDGDWVRMRVVDAPFAMTPEHYEAMETVFD